MKKKIKIKTFWGELLFEFEKEDNTVKDKVKAIYHKLEKL